MTIEASSISPRFSRKYDRQFYTGMAIVVAVAVVVGFAPTYYLRPRFVPDALPYYLHVHGLVFSAWIAFFIAQATLVAVRRTDVHRTLGWIGAGLAALMVLAGTTAGILSGQRDVAAGQEDAARTFLTVPLFSMAVFAALVAAAVSFRRQSETHKRLMLLATISLLDAPLARWPGAPSSLFQIYILVDLFIVAGILYDLVSRRRVAPAYLWGGLLIVAGQWLRDVVGQTEAWHAFARTLLG
ncbi:MAG TPA: hypothetical protein VI485_20455 [Vicinamibacterales bacterium]|nr:hypothetical protein [Vicinamibacterales bacterium]